jgi:hypothetical protein
MDPIKLPFWLEGVELSKLRDAATAYWAQIEAWIRWPLTQFDALTCSEGVLKLLAYQRDIQRFTGEPLDLFRKRVAFAYANAEDAGSKAGFIAIFERLGIGALAIDERIAGIDWDIVHLKVSDQQLATYRVLLDQVVAQYRRTCRRYTFAHTLGLTVSVKLLDNGCDWNYDYAKQSDVLDNTNIIPATVAMQPFDYAWAIDTAKL